MPWLGFIPSSTVGTTAVSVVPTTFNQPTYVSTAAAVLSGTGGLSRTLVTNSVTTAGGIRYMWIEEDWMQQSQYAALAQQRAYGYLTLQAERQRQQELEMARQAQLSQQRAQTLREQHATALAKSRELLLSHLTPAQRATFENNGWFVVTGGKSDKQYRIQTASYVRNIEEMRGKKVTHLLCGHLRDAVPLYDHHVAQKISLECDEEAFVRLCNRSAA